MAGEEDKRKEYGSYGEKGLFYLIQFSLVLTMLIAEKTSLFSIIILFTLFIIYSLFGYSLKSNKKRIGFSILAFILLTLTSFAFPLRELNILSIFIIIGSLLTLLPGKFVMSGEELWKESKVMFLLILAVGLGFLTINFFSLNFQAVSWFLTNFFGIIGILMVVAIAAIIILGLLGIRFSRD